MERSTKGTEIDDEGKEVGDSYALMSSKIISVKNEGMIAICQVACYMLYIGYFT